MEPYLADVGVRKCLPPFGYTQRGKPRLLSKDDEKVTALQPLSLVFAFMLKDEGQTSGEMWEFRNVQMDVL